EPIGGRPPDLIHPPQGCPFHPRCRFAEDKCRAERPPLAEVETGRRAACWFPFIDDGAGTSRAETMETAGV
ncbi:oligopeptide/dipeptide ABC transporter ATP-binding protein, partial [Aurantimonas sp. 22II-16-19i]|uniref:oligopeptide/dipeptide ABC transporter ATP-binding protein n=1 Tax=Aurantimonas sp. 22II-16-19i TaxID=1317114 RepID=UPI0009F7DEF3